MKKNFQQDESGVFLSCCITVIFTHRLIMLDCYQETKQFEKYNFVPNSVNLLPSCFIPTVPSDMAARCLESSARPGLCTLESSHQGGPVGLFLPVKLMEHLSDKSKIIERTQNHRNIECLRLQRTLRITELPCARLTTIRSKLYEGDYFVLQERTSMHSSRNPVMVMDNLCSEEKDCLAANLTLLVVKESGASDIS